MISMALPPLEIKITADPSQAEVGLSRVAKATEAAERAAEKYADDLATVDRAVKKGLISQTQASSAVKQAEKAYERASVDAAKFANATAKVSRQSVGAAGAFGRLGSASGAARSQIQNAAFQLQDITVQIQGGTAASTALAQQLPQLAGAFGAVGAVVGAGLGIGIPILAAAFGGTTEQAKSLEDQMDALTGATASFQEATDLARGSTAELRDIFGQYSEDVRQTLVLLSDIEQQKAFEALTASASAAYDEMSRIKLLIADIMSGDAPESPAVTRILKDEFQLTYNEAARLLTILDHLRNAKGPEDAANHAQRLRDHMISVYGAVDDIPPVLRNVLEAVLKIDVEASKVVKTLDDAGTAAQFVVDVSGGIAVAIGSAIPAAQSLGDALWNAFDAAKALSDERAAAIAGGPDAARFSTMNALNPRGGQRSDTVFKRTFNTGSKKTSRRGGGKKKGANSAADDILDRLEGVQEALQTEAETLRLGYEEQQAVLEEALSKKRLSQEEFQDWSKRSQTEYNDALAAIERDKKNAMLSDIGGAFGDLSSLMSSENKKLFNIGKAAAIAEASISGYKSAVSAWEKGMAIGGPPVAAAFASLSAVKTAGLIGQISSQQIGGGSGASSSGGGSAAATSGTVNTLNANLRVTGDAAFASSPGAISNFTDALMTEFSDRGITVVTAQ